MFDFLGKIPNEIVIACSGNKNSMAVVEFLSRTNRDITILHVDFKDEDSKDRVNYIKTASRIYKTRIDVVKPLTIKGPNEYPDHYKNREILTACRKYSPKLVIMASTLEDVVIQYLHSAIKCTPKLLPYRTHNIIRPYINTHPDEIEHWIKTKKVGYFEGISKKIPNQLDFIHKHVLDNCIKINPDIYEHILNAVNDDFKMFLANRRYDGT